MTVTWDCFSVWQGFADVGVQPGICASFLPLLTHTCVSSLRLPQAATAQPCAYILLRSVPARTILFACRGLLLQVQNWWYESIILQVFCYRAVCKEFGVHVGRMCLAFQLFAAGMFVSSAAFLPSSWAMCSFMCACAAWWQQRYPLAVFFVALGSLLGKFAWTCSIYFNIKMPVGLATIIAPLYWIEMRVVRLFYRQPTHSTISYTLYLLLVVIFLCS